MRKFLRRLYLNIQKGLKNQKGFSLMEISVALIVMGVLIAGSIKGYALVESAQVKAVAKSIDHYKMAVHMFKDQYGALPGDFAQASQVIHPDLVNGNGNGRIEGDGLGDHRSEAVNFWQHLAQAGFISNPGPPPQMGTADFGAGAPKEKIGGGITLVQDPNGLTRMAGLWFVLGQKVGAQGTGGVVTPKQALMLLNQMDSSDPLAGQVRAGPGAGVPYEDCIKNGQLNGEVDYPACIVYFKL